MSGQDEFEDDLLHAMTRTGEGFRPDQAPLAAGGLARGRRRWRRRSAAAVVSGAAALALVGTGAVYLSGGAGDSRTGTALTAAASGSGAAAASGTAGAASPTASPTASPSASQAVISGDEVLATLRSLLPKGQVTEGKGRGTDDPELRGAFAGADLVLDDGQGKSRVQIGIQKHRKGQSQPRTCPADLKVNRIDSCAVTKLPDGSELVLNQGHEYSDNRADTKEWFAALTGPDGREIMLSEWNSPQEKGAPDSRPNPPLTLDQLKAVVTDKSWDRTVAALQYDGVDNAAQASGMTLEDRQAALGKLLPAGVTVTGITGNEIFADVRLAQGAVTGSLVLRLQKVEPGDKSTEQLFEGSTALPDGSRLKLYGAGSTDAKRPPTADVLRGDGLRVMVAQGSTGKPVLTLDQLKAIASSPLWKAGK
ncbi:hypothetical protein [Streptomyces sp. CB01881]|uniref:hypothetical protein n=1 Tax=Streptomyces sp. CB01881 TaxID=2078691 RepID=UPI000CDC854C|nr:hypothetical protein [Streptomyces sp. CB01881]AUY51731.1 hypothetical protein C2142_25545 [Streptomyces sp. CB01881]TYC71158.1 hypothetical protein EH183_25530 [Streptomyces sp. CB01881]